MSFAEYDTSASWNFNLQLSVVADHEKIPELGSEDWQDEWSAWRMFSVEVLWHRPVDASFQLSVSPKAWIKVVGFINQTRYLVLIFSRKSVFEALAGRHCAWRSPHLHITSPKQGPQAVSPALRSSKLWDTVVKLNLCASLSPGCRERTSGMLLDDKRRLVVCFLWMLTFGSLYELDGNSWHWGWIGSFHKEASRLSFRLCT